MPSLGPDRSYFSIMFSYCCLAQGLQISPSRENAWNPGQSPVQKPCGLLPAGSFPPSKLCRRCLRSVWDSGLRAVGTPVSKTGPTWSCGCCQHELSLHGFDPTVIQIRNEEMGPGCQPSSYLLVLTTCPRENVWSASVRLWKIIGFQQRELTNCKRFPPLLFNLNSYYLWGNKDEDKCEI